MPSNFRLKRFLLNLAVALFMLLMAEVLSPYFSLPEREAWLAITAALFVGMGLAFRLVPNIESWGGYRYLAGWNTMLSFLGALWLVRTVVVFQRDGLPIWPLVRFSALGVLVGFAFSWFFHKNELCESTE